MSIEEKLREAARDFSGLRATAADEKAIFGMVLGTLYALDRAIRLGFKDRTGSGLPEDYADELASLASKLGDGKSLVDGQWLAGFYLNSAMQRLSPASERMGKYVNMRQDLVPAVREEVNRLKHDVDGLIAGRTVSIDEAVDAAVLVVAAASTICRNRGHDG